MRALWGSIIMPLLEKIRSTGADVAGTHNRRSTSGLKDWNFSQNFFKENSCEMKSASFIFSKYIESCLAGLNTVSDTVATFPSLSLISLFTDHVRFLLRWQKHQAPWNYHLWQRLFSLPSRPTSCLSAGSTPQSQTSHSWWNRYYQILLTSNVTLIPSQLLKKCS